MEIQVTEKEYCTLSVLATADLQAVKDVTNDVLKELKDVRVHGFRQGKAPLEAIKLKFKKDITARVRARLAEQAYEKLLADTSVEAMGNPRFEELNFDDKTFSCRFELHTKPTFELGNYKNFSLVEPEKKSTSEEYAESLVQELRERNGETLPFTDDDFVQSGDSVIIDYEASLDGEPCPELTATKEVMTVGKSPLQSFDDNLLGMKGNDVREFSITGPDNGGEKFKGKTITFKVTLVMGAKNHPAPLDDSLATRLGYESYDALRQHLSGVASQRLDEHRTRELLQQVMLRLLEGHDFKVPEWLAVAEAQLNARRAKASWDQLTDQQREQMLDSATKSVKVSLVLQKIRENEPDAQISDEEVFGFIQQQLALMSSEQQQSVESQIQTMAEDGRLQLLATRIRDEHVLKFVLNNSTVTE